MSALAANNQWRILCVDDEQDILDILDMTLSMSYEVVTANDGVEAMQMLDLSDPDFIICDVRMPNMDGFQTVQAIRKHPTFHDIPVFFLTAERGTDNAKRGFESGCNLYLTKPFEPDRVMQNIDHFLKQSGAPPRVKRMTKAEIDAELQRLKSGESLAQSSEESAETGDPRVALLIHDQRLMSIFEGAVRNDFEVIPCPDPLNSIQKIFRYEPDIIIINPAFSGISGMGLAKMIHTTPRLRRIPLVLIKDPREPFDERILPSITKEPLMPASASAGSIREEILKISKRGDFVVHPKRASLESLVAEESQLGQQIQMEEDREKRAEKRQSERYGRIQKFIDSNN